jgi:hypothetical protein
MPAQRRLLSVSPDNGTKPYLPRTEEARGSNPLTSTYRDPRDSRGFLVGSALGRDESSEGIAGSIDYLTDPSSSDSDSSS